MNAIAHDFPIRGANRPDPVHSLAVEWELLCDAGARVAQLAGEAETDSTESFPGGAADLVAAIERLGGAHRRLMEQHLADLSAVMQPGLLTLETIAAHGQDVSAAARVLWREFAHARAAIATMVTEPA